MITGEPATTAAGTAAGWKLIGGAAGALGIGAAIVTVVVMLMTPPRSPREWAVGLISTVVGSITGGAALVEYFHLHAWMVNFTGLLAILGIAFACGLPAWAVVRWVFTAIEKRRDQDIAQIVDEVKKHIKG